jgi:xylan 1,4-beta-xylosidase
MSHPNPVIAGFHPDPSVCRAGEEYYLATSTFAYLPGAPIFRSSDLTSWTQIGNALARPSQLDLTATGGSASLGMFAPTLRHHDGRFWLITTNVTHAGAHTFVVTAEDPAGPWSEPMPVPVDGFDPDIAWDDEGRCFVHISTMSEIVRHRIDEGTGDVLASGSAWSGTGLHCPEAPHLFRRGSHWYLVIAEGGTERGHCVSIARSDSPEGPWESCPANPILSHRSTGSPIRNTGHADFVEAPDGSWWMVLLGVRARGTAPGFHVLGRETFLVAVDWVDDWPVPADLALGASVASGTERETFIGPLGSEWLSLRQLPTACSSVEGGELIVDDGGLVLKRQQHHRMRARARVRVTGAAEGGVSVFMDESHRYDVFLKEGTIVARAAAGGLGHHASAHAPHGPVVLVVETRPHASGPDAIALGFEDAQGRRHVLAELDGRYLSTEVTGGFTGRMIGMFAVGGRAAFDWFEYESLD